jgi:uncharacterized membrane protein YeaQ/YmgE (transglycosylase-associated protein family)
LRGALKKKVCSVKTITLLAVTAMLLVDVFGSKSSVGGPMTDLLVVFIVMLAVGIYEAWSKKRGPVGWIVNIVASIIGGFVAVSLTATAMESILTEIHFQGKLASSHHPMRYISELAMAIFTILGSWIALQLVNVFPKRKEVKPS